MPGGSPAAWPHIKDIFQKIAAKVEDGTPCCMLMLENELVPVRPTPRRAFQGWRYLDAEEAPADLARTSASGIVAMPPKLRKQLAELGLL